MSGEHLVAARLLHRDVFNPDVGQRKQRGFTEPKGSIFR